MHYILLNKNSIFLIIWLIILGSGCGGSASNENNAVTDLSFDNYIYQQPVVQNDGWETAHLNELSLESSDFENLVKKINDENDGYRHIDSVMVIKNGKIIFEENFRSKLDLADGWANNQDLSLHILNSVTKSFTSALIGIAIDKGDIPSVDVKVHDYFSHKLPVNGWNEDKENITLKNWLTMRHGYVWDEWNVSYLNNNNLNSQMNNASDPINFLLSRPMATTPGETFTYSTGVSFGLGRLLEHATGQSITSFMEQNLFAPLGIEKYTYWALDGQLHTGSALYLSPRDMAKFGQLFLNKGVWNGEQIISESWIEESTTRYHDAEDWGYSYQWWLTSFNVKGQEIQSFYADGYGGQYIFVLPEIDSVVVFTGRAYQEGEIEEYRVRTVMQNDILSTLL
ncbi:MAG: serine hydrolase [Colwellia sp.]|nr:serine hydrolase [Colwellia sp.]